MEFGNPIVGGETLVRNAIQSQNYAAGSAGWSIQKNGSAEFNQITIRNGETVSSTDLYYNGTPAAGNLIASISAVQGIDPFGNTYFPGICTYNGNSGSSTFVQLLNGELFCGIQSSNINSDAMLGYTTSSTLEKGTFPSAVLNAPTNGTYTYTGTVVAAPGNDSTPTTGPRIMVVEKNGGSAVHLGVSGVVLPTDNGGSALATLGVNNFNTGWNVNTAYGSIASVEPLSYAMLPSGHIHVHGAFRTGSPAPTTNTVFTLPSGYYRTDRVQLFTWHGRIAPNSNETIGTGSVNTNGGVALSSTNTGSTSPLVANSTFWMDFVVDGPDVQ